MGSDPREYSPSAVELAVYQVIKLAAAGFSGFDPSTSIVYANQAGARPQRLHITIGAGSPQYESTQIHVMEDDPDGDNLRSFHTHQQHTGTVDVMAYGSGSQELLSHIALGFGVPAVQKAMYAQAVKLRPLAATAARTVINLDTSIQHASMLQLYFTTTSTRTDRIEAIESVILTMN